MTTATTRRLATLPVTVLLLASSACGKELGRLPFAAEGTREAQLTLSAKEVSFWTDIDIEYEGDGALSYKIDLVQNGKTVATAVCNPLERMSVRTGWVETNVNESHSRRGSGKMSCSATLGSEGPTTVKATLAFQQRPRTVSLKKADLVVKQ